jgi:hypothetical protein
MSETELIIRASSLSGYADCPRRSAARMFRSIITAAGYDLRELPNGIGASVGSAVHAGAAISLKHKALHGDCCPEDVATDTAVEVLRETVLGGTIFDRETPILNIAEQQAVRMIRTYRSQVAREIQPMIIEERLEAEVRPGLILSGQADVIAREPGRVRDIKTGKRLGNHIPQIGAYSLLARSAGVDIQSAGIDYVARAAMTKSRLPNPQPDAVMIKVHVANAETAATRVIDHIAADLATFTQGDDERRIQPGDPWAFIANPSSMLCGDKYCPAWGTSFCVEHAKRADDDE